VLQGPLTSRTNSFWLPVSNLNFQPFSQEAYGHFVRHESLVTHQKLLSYNPSMWAHPGCVYTRRGIRSSGDQRCRMLFRRYTWRRRPSRYHGRRGHQRQMVSRFTHQLKIPTAWLTVHLATLMPLIEKTKSLLEFLVMIGQALQ